LHFGRAAARIDQPLYNSVFHQLQLLAWYTFAIEGRTGLLGVRNVVPYIDVLAEELRADAIVQKRSLIENCQASKIEKPEADGVEDGRWLKHDRVLASRNLARCG